MSVRVQQLDRWRLSRRTKRTAAALLVAFPVVFSVIARRSLRGGGAPVWGLALAALLVLSLAAVESFRLWLRKRRFVSTTEEPLLLGTCSYREVFEFLHGVAGHEEVVLWGTDACNLNTCVAIQPKLSPIRFDFLSAWGPESLGSIDGPQGLEVVVWARGDQIRAIELVFGDRTLQIDGRGSVVKSGVG